MTTKKSKTVYRVVGPDNAGYYFSEGGELLHRVNRVVGYDTGSPKDHHPMPIEDGIDYVPDDYKFGFEALRHLKNWFTPDIMKAAAQENCKVQIWEVKSDYKLGGRQMCFDDEKASLQEVLPLKSFLKHE